MLAFVDEIKKEGRVRHVGFSFHDTLAVFKEIVDTCDWTVCQIQYNYLDEQYQAGSEGLAYAASKGIAVVVMEPLRGGKLAKVPPEVQRLFESSPVKRTPAEWGLRWVWNRPEVSTVLSGMSSLEQVRENIDLAHNGRAESLTTEDLTLIDRARQAFRSLLTVDCTGCAYCMPCSTGVNIPMNLALYNDMVTFKDPTGVMIYNAFLPPEQRASVCVECGECEKKCPQHIQIREELQKAHAVLFREAEEAPHQQ